MPRGGERSYVVDCVVYVVRMVELVDMCCRCDYEDHGEIYGGREDGVPRAWWCYAESKEVVVVLLFVVMAMTWMMC